MMPVIKDLPANSGDIRDVGLIPGSGSSLKKEMATDSTILSRRITWTGALRLHSIGSQRVGHD